MLHHGSVLQNRFFTHMLKDSPKHPVSRVLSIPEAAAHAIETWRGGRCRMNSGAGRIRCFRRFSDVTKPIVRFMAREKILCGIRMSENSTKLHGFEGGIRDQDEFDLLAIRAEPR